MEIFILGAGKPKRGTEPSALKQISLKSVTLDWQIESFKEISTKTKIIFLGGYEINKIKKKIPIISFKKIKKPKNILDTFLNINFNKRDKIITYSDTIFRKEIYKKIIKQQGDVVFAVDSTWKNRFASRTKNDIKEAEKIYLNNFSSKSKKIVEFTGLFLLREKSIEYIKKNKSKIKGSSIVDLLQMLKKSKLNLNFIDIKNNWAELNFESDVSRFVMGTKSETLDRIKPVLKKSIIGNQYRFTINEWKTKNRLIQSNIKKIFKKNHVVVRSSSNKEDNWKLSNAGAFASVLNVDLNNNKKLIKAINTVIKSYGNKLIMNDQVFVQKQIKNILFSGVAFTCDLENGQPYYKINFDENSTRTDTITSGKIETSKNIVIHKNFRKEAGFKFDFLKKLILSISEIENKLNYHKLDIEFAVDRKKNVHIFQIRPISIDHSDFEKFYISEINNKLNQSVIKFKNLDKKLIKDNRNKTIYGNMPDWNPAEIIGVKPNPLAKDLYKYLITNSVWAKQRGQFGYKYLKNMPLMIDFCNQPYVNVRSSFSSFIPKNLPNKMSDKLCNAYIDILKNNPNLHDKVEFEILFTIWTPSFNKVATKRLKKYKFNTKEIKTLEKGLKDITIKSFIRLDKDTKNINKLIKNRAIILNSKKSEVIKFSQLLNDCKKYGTLPFAHAARAGFVSITILKSFVVEKILTLKRFNDFMNGVNSVAKDFENELSRIKINKKNRLKFINKFGHLRPGTYEIGNKAYWEEPDFYLNTNTSIIKKKFNKFIPNKIERKKIELFLKKLGSSISVDDLISYFYKSIEYRESTKFEFTKNLSKALDILVSYGKNQNFTREDLSFIKINEIKLLNKKKKLNLKNLIQRRKKDYNLTNQISLPSLITNENDFYFYEQNTSVPNFISLSNITGSIIEISDKTPKNISERIYNKIVMIERADPGYDYLFTYSILGLITKYGGANSHMAIRSAEKNLPAAIGVGAKIYNKLMNFKIIKMDCKNKTIEGVN